MSLPYLNSPMASHHPWEEAQTVPFVYNALLSNPGPAPASESKEPLKPSQLGRVQPWLPGPGSGGGFGEALWGAGVGVSSEDAWGAGQEATSLQIIFLGLFGGQRLKLLGEGRAGALQSQPVGKAGRGL